MCEIQQFVQSAVLLFILTGISVLKTGHPYMCLMLSGILFIVFTIRSLNEEKDLILLCIQIIISAAFVWCSGTNFSFLIFYECRLYKKPTNILFPGVTFGLYQTIFHTVETPWIICYILILIMVSSVMGFFESAVNEYFMVRMRIEESVSVAAINEMYQKKLNHELIIKNYLADRNARLEERENISRSIHNSVGHSITAAIMTLDAADMILDSSPDKAREKVNKANERMRGSLDSIHQAVRVLDNGNDFKSIEDFLKDLTEITQNFVMDTQIKMHTDYLVSDNNINLPDTQAEFLIGAVQEFLSNGVRHGNADSFTVIAVSDSRHIKVSVQDNGKSDFSNENRVRRIKAGFGLKKIISYAHRCGGDVELINENGFKAEVVLPIFRKDENVQI
ncbi:MAG: hypothetical protein HDT39_04150 [Lachnospiraceae bacterium]|nr:hypothetical protein [Lachnospiraceae bacterium]